MQVVDYVGGYVMNNVGSFAQEQTSRSLYSVRHYD
jgi:hypothetical protein